MHILRREFLVMAGGAGVAGLGLFSVLPRVSAAEAQVDSKRVEFSPDIEPLVRFIEETPRERLLEEAGARIRRGLTYRDLLAALLLAGIRNVQPRPVGFKFHAVLVIHSAHLASLAAPDSERWLPIFWALDYFKVAQAQDKSGGDWTMGPPPKASQRPTADRARQMFIEGMDRWDEGQADAAVTALAKGDNLGDLFPIFCRYGARDFRNIGHKAIYVANTWRALQVLGPQHAEPILRSLTYALLDHSESKENPSKADLSADRPWRTNQPIAGSMPASWVSGEVRAEASTGLLDVLRQGSAADASAKVAGLMSSGVAPQSIWDALFTGAGEILMRAPGIISLHAVTATNALRYSFQNCGDDETRRMLILQCASFLPLFRGAPKNQGVKINELEPLNSGTGGSIAVEEIFADIGKNNATAARKVLTLLKDPSGAKQFTDAARRFIFMKGTNAHDYKFSSAVIEDHANLSPGWRDRLMAASVFNLRGSGSPDNELVRRTRAALAG